jgi:putative hydrolase
MDENKRIAACLREAAERLEACGNNAFRAGAFRRAADVVEASPRSLREVYERYGITGLEEMPAIGPGIAAAIVEMLMTGRWKHLERLRKSRERVLSYVDDEGVERYCSVLDIRPPSRLHGRDAIAALLGRK